MALFFNISTFFKYYIKKKKKIIEARVYYEKCCKATILKIIFLYVNNYIYKSYFFSSKIQIKTVFNFIEQNSRN